MTGDKLKRVQAVRKWLEKAEQSFTLHRDISGEWNLIMAQAEMQRLRETDRAGRRRRLWGSRVLALAAAAALFSGYSLWQSYREEPVPIPAVVPAEQTAAAPEPAREAPPLPEAAAVSAALPAAGAETVPAKPQETPAASAAASPPALSEWEIQSVVGEAGRALRGQS